MHKKSFGHHTKHKEHEMHPHKHHEHMGGHKEHPGSKDGNEVMHEVAAHLDSGNAAAHSGGKPAPDQGRRD